VKLVVEPHPDMKALEQEVHKVKARFEEYERRLRAVEVAVDFSRRYGGPCPICLRGPKEGK
jgi:hypothetical protein